MLSPRAFARRLAAAVIVAASPSAIALAVLVAAGALGLAPAAWALAVIAGTPNMLIVGPKVKAQSVAELVADAKGHPGKYNVGSSGLGTTIHLTSELFKLQTGTKITHIAYRGQADALNAILSGETDMMFDTASIHVANVKAGKVRALGVAAAERFKPLPAVPTLAEGGVKGV